LAKPAPGYAGQADQTQPAKPATQEPSSMVSQLVLKTYTLAHIKPEELLKAARVLLEDASFSDNMITVKIWNGRIPKFEELLRKLDVEKKTVHFQVFAIVASREPGAKTNDTIENKELKRVLDELRSLWNFNAYNVDGPSFVTVHEGSEQSVLKLVTNRPLNLFLSNVKVVGEDIGKRTVSIEELKLTGLLGRDQETVFLDTRDTTLKENGYLVAGVSGYGSAAIALILVINAEIK
jgi:hypothetical protein